MEKHKTNKRAILLLIVSIIVIAVLAIVAFFALKKDKPSFISATSNDEEEIKRVIETYMKANAGWDYETALSCIAEESSLRANMANPEEMARNGLRFNLEQGFVVEKDIEKYIDLNKKWNKLLEEKSTLNFEKIDIDGDTAFAYIKGKSATTSGMYVNDDSLFYEICGMSEQDAYAKLTPEEYSKVRLQVVEKAMEDEIRKETFVMNDFSGKVELRKIDGKWFIYDIKNI